MPNAGKSTLINQIVERRVCATSMKVHTTMRNSKAIDNSGNTQLIFLDTPGLVTQSEMKRHALEPTYSTAPVESVKEADLIAVVQDVSNNWTRDFLDKKVIFLLEQAPEKESILILNKVDLIKGKRFLLRLTEKLTEGKLDSLEKNISGNEEINVQRSQDEDNFLPDADIISSESQKRIGWDKFSEVFMVSALSGEGVGDIKEYMLMRAKDSSWQFDPDAFTDQDSKQMVEEAVREKLLDNLPQEIPYSLSSEMEFFSHSTTGLLCISVLVHCKHLRHQKLLISGGGHRVRMIAKEAEQTLANCFRCPVKLKVVVDVVKEKSDHSNYASNKSLFAP